jgi:hypothetical protein
MTLRFVPHISAIGAVAGIAACGQAPQKRESAVAEQCDTAGLAPSPGFCATIFADKIGHVRHIVAGADGTLYANGAPDPEDEAVASGLIVLQDGASDEKLSAFNGLLPARSAEPALRYSETGFFWKAGTASSAMT